MAADEFHDELHPIGGSRAAAAPIQSGGIAARPVFRESITIGSLTAAPEKAGSAIEDVVIEAPRAGRQLSDSTRRMLANLDAHGSVADPPAGAAPSSSPAPAGPAAAEAPASASQAAPSSTTPAGAAAAPPPPTISTADAVAGRLAARNAELVAEVERLRTQPREISPRERSLDEAERAYVDGPIPALRRFLATVIGVDDPNHADVTAELSGLYKDLTAQELGVALDGVESAKREAARTRLALARDRRERAEQQKPQPAAAPEALPAEHVQIVTDHLAPIADKHPLLMSLAERLDGKKPAELVLAIIRSGIRTGEYDPKARDIDLVAAASKKAETHYQALADTLGAARPQAPSTATASTATTASPQGAQGQGHGTRTITQADASVAPATSPPAKQAEQERSRPQPPRGLSEKQRRAWLADYHFNRTAPKT